MSKFRESLGDFERVLERLVAYGRVCESFEVFEGELGYFGRVWECLRGLGKV